MDQSTPNEGNTHLSLCYKQDSNVCDTLDVSVRSIEVFVFVFDTYWQLNQESIRRQDIQMLAVSTLAFVIKEVDREVLPLDRMMFLCRNSHPAESFTSHESCLKSKYTMVHEIVSPSRLLRSIDPDFDFDDFKVAIIFFYQMNDKGTIMEAVDLLYITMRFIRTSPLMVDINGENVDRITSSIRPYLHRSEADLEAIVSSINEFVTKNDSETEAESSTNNNNSQISIEDNLSRFCSENDQEFEEEIFSPILQHHHHHHHQHQHHHHHHSEKQSQPRKPLDQLNLDNEFDEGIGEEKELENPVQVSIGFESGVFLSSPNLLSETDQKADNSYASTTITALHSNYSSLSTVTNSQGFEIRPSSKSLFAVFPADQLNSSSFQFPEYPSFSPPVKAQQQTKSTLIELFPSNDCITYQQFPTAFTLDDEVI